MRSIIIAVVAAFTLAGAASAAGPHTYQYDAHKRCHDESGRFVAASFCKPAPPGMNRCRDPKTGRFVKCAPGARRP